MVGYKGTEIIREPLLKLDFKKTEPTGGTELGESIMGNSALMVLEERLDYKGWLWRLYP